MKKRVLYFFLAFPLFAGANIAMTSASTSVDGLSITVQMSGSVLCPSNQCTGFAFGYGGYSNFYGINSATPSGSTITLALSQAVTIDDGLTLDLAPNSNITDASADTVNPNQQYASMPVTNNSSWFAATGPEFAAISRVQGGAAGTELYPFSTAAAWDSADGYLEFQTCSTSINVSAFLYGSHYILNQDGQQIYDWGKSNSASNIVAPLGAVSNLSGCHIYQVVQIDPTTPFETSLLRAIQLTPGPGQGAAQPAVRPIIAESGDSLVELGGPQPPADSRTAHLWLSSAPLGLADQHTGYDGYAVYGQLSFLAPKAFEGLGAPALLGYLRGGGNDIGLVANGEETLAQFSTAWGQMISAVEASPQPPVNLVALGIPYTTLAYADGLVDELNSLISAQASAVGIPYVDLTKWICGTCDRQTDNIHFNPTGEAVSANRFLPITAGYALGASYTVSGPASGTAGTSSSPFTVALQGGATWTADYDGVCREIVTLNDGGAGGTFTTQVGPSGVGPLAVCATAGNSWTFTYNRPSPGMSTITLTSASNLGWHDPGPLQYSANGAKITPMISWAAPAAINFGSALSSIQLDATAGGVPGTFVYTPPAGTVLPPGSGQTLSVAFTPTNTSVYANASGSTTITVNPGAASGSASLIVTSLLTRNNGNVMVQITIANTGGTTAANVTLSNAKVGADVGTPLPQNLGAVSPGTTVQATVTVPGSVGASGAAGSLTISGTYTGGTFSSSARITLP